MFQNKQKCKYFVISWPLQICEIGTFFCSFFTYKSPNSAMKLSFSDFEQYHTVLNIWVEQTLCEFKKKLLLCEYCIQFFAYYTILFNCIHQRMFGFLFMVNCFLSHHRIKYHLSQIHGEKNNTRHLKRFLNWISSKTSIV